MIKLLWYAYFSIYLLLVSLTRIMVAYLRRVDNKAADIYAYKQVKRISEQNSQIEKSHWIIRKLASIIAIIGKTLLYWLITL